LNNMKVSVALCLAVFLLAHKMSDGFRLSRTVAWKVAGKTRDSRLFYGHFAGGIKSKNEEGYSFVQDEMRKYAMKLHTKDQSPKEGEQKAQIPFTKWEPERSHYAQFLIDSLEVYQAMDEIVAANPVLAEKFANTGLERTESIKQSLKWMTEFDPTLKMPECGEAGKGKFYNTHHITYNNL